MFYKVLPCSSSFWTNILSAYRVSRAELSELSELQLSIYTCSTVYHANNGINSESYKMFLGNLCRNSIEAGTSMHLNHIQIWIWKMNVSFLCLKVMFSITNKVFMRINCKVCKTFSIFHSFGLALARSICLSLDKSTILMHKRNVVKRRNELKMFRIWNIICIYMNICICINASTWRHYGVLHVQKANLW